MKIKEPYYAVIFTSEKGENQHGYEQMAIEMEALVQKQDGFLGMDSLSSENQSITISYWRDLEAIYSWKNNLKHKEAQALGKMQWYDNYKIKISKIEYEYDVNRE